MDLIVYTVTSKSATVQWTPFSGATFYQLTATPKNSPQGQVVVQFGGNTVIGSIISLSPDTQYTVRVEAMDNQMTVLASAETDAQTAPDIPSIGQTYSKTSDSITVEFAPVTGATGYILRAESKTGNFFSETSVNSSPGSVLGLEPYTEYKISILSVNDGGRSQPSYSVDQRTVIVAPVLNTTSPTSTSIVITWEPVDHAAQYIFVIIQEGSNTRIDTSTNDTMLELEDLQPGTNYTIKVQALDDENRPGDDLTFGQITRPSSPDIPSVYISSQGRSAAMIFWGTVPGASYYTVTTSDNQTCTSSYYSYCSLEPIICSQDHKVRVTAYNTAGPSIPSKPGRLLTYPCPPNNTRIVESGNSDCSVLWDKVKKVDYYMAYVKGNDGQEITFNTTDTKAEFDCPCGHTFIAIVVPYNKIGGSPIMQLVNYTTVPCCPASLKTTLVSSDTVEIEWSDVSGAVLYQVTASETKNTLHCNDTEPICALSDLKCDTTYSIKVTPCSEVSGCNKTCPAHTQTTAPCAPEVKTITQESSGSYKVCYSTPNRAGTSYTITATGSGGTEQYTCQDTQDCCDLTGLLCGKTFKVKAVAKSAGGVHSLPGYEKPLETGPCCPDSNSIKVDQLYQAMTNVSWAPARGACSYITSLTSKRGAAKCHTEDHQCLMGCITCNTNYNISMEAISCTGHKTQCNYTGFSSSPCCPLNVKLYRFLKNNNTTILRVTWKQLSTPYYKHNVEIKGLANANPLNCTAPPGQKFCEVVEPTCAIVYTVTVAPVVNGTKVSFCQPRKYRAPCPPSATMIEAVPE